MLIVGSGSETAVTGCSETGGVTCASETVGVG